MGMSVMLSGRRSPGLRVYEVAKRRRRYVWMLCGEVGSLAGTFRQAFWVLWLASGIARVVALAESMYSHVPLTVVAEIASHH